MLASMDSIHITEWMAYFKAKNDDQERERKKQEVEAKMRSSSGNISTRKR